MTGATFRIEHDTLGSVQVPSERKWGAQTQRALGHFAISSETQPIELLRALIILKKVCALANAELGVLAPQAAQAIAAAADDLLAHDDWPREFPLSVWQSGSGTQTHMNVNEVLARCANQRLERLPATIGRLHPNDHVNLGQSSNDLYVSAIHVAAADALVHKVLPALDELAAALHAQAVTWRDLLKIGRTHLQDAVPITLGQEFSGYARQVADSATHLRGTVAPLCELALGGTAVGTGLNAHPELAARALHRLRELVPLPWSSAPNKFAAIAGADALIQSHGALKAAASALLKVANDIRWLASGPRCGLGELQLPPNEPGSSIMPGKVNPTQCEALIMIAWQVFANDVAVGMGGSGGFLELNTARPLIAHNFLQSCRLIADGASSFRRHCIVGIEPDIARLRETVDRSLMLVTALAPRIGYEAAARLAGLAHARNLTLREAAAQSNVIDLAEFDQLTNPMNMLGPGAK